MSYKTTHDALFNILSARPEILSSCPPDRNVCYEVSKSGHVVKRLVTDYNDENYAIVKSMLHDVPSKKIRLFGTSYKQSEKFRLFAFGKFYFYVYRK